MSSRPQVTRLRCLAVAVSLALAACGDAESTTSGPATFEVAEAPVLVDDTDLVEVVDVRTDAAGHTWVISPHAPLVRVYGADGTRVAAFGQPGGGPEEFGNPWALVGTSEGDGMGVLDNRRGNLRYYAPDGTLRSERAVDALPPLPSEIRAVFFGDLARVWRVDGGLLQDRYPAGEAGMPMPMQQAHDFWIADLVFLPDDEGEPRTLLSFGDFAEFDPEAPRTPNPLAAGPLWDACPGGDEFVFHTGAASEIVRVGVDGRVRSRIPVDLPLDPVDVEVVTDWMVSVMGGVPTGPGDSPEAMRERIGAVAALAEPNFEPNLPPTRLRCDEEGRVWVQLFDLEHDQRGYAREWVVVDREGRIAANVTFPPRFHPMRIGPDRVVGVVRDENDVERVGWVPTPELR